MTELDPAVLNELLTLLQELKGDWEYTGELTPQTRFVADLGLESLEIVVLSTTIQQRYGRLPFPAFFEEIGQRPVESRDINVADLVDFVAKHRQTISQEA